MDPMTKHAVRSPVDVGRKRTKPDPESGTVQITFRLSVEKVRQLDAEAESIKREHPGLPVGRTEVLRMFIDESLARRSKRSK